MFNFLNSKIKIDVLIIDMSMFDYCDLYDIINSILFLRKTHAIDFKIACLISEYSNCSKVKDVISLGIDGVIPCEEWLGKNKETEAIESICAGSSCNHKKLLNLLLKKEEKTCFSLTPRQDQIHSLICTRGISNKIIAKTLNISESTVKLHVSGILKKIGAKSRSQLIVFNKKTDQSPPSCKK